jgi:hypothetical protein
MIEGHTLRALLDPSIKAGTVFGYHELLHNLPGPAFLFGSGLAFSFATVSDWDSYLHWNRKVAMRLLRFLTLLLLGYMLHLTYFSLRRTLAEGTAEQLTYLLSMDILQCIAISGILLQLLLMLFRDEKRFLAVIAILCMIVSLSTAFVWKLSNSWPMWIGTSLGGNRGSPFPLFPYIGIEFAGAALGILFIRSVQSGSESALLRKAVRWSASLVLICGALSVLPTPSIFGDYWLNSPIFFFLRLGLLILIAIVFRKLEFSYLDRLKSLAVLGRESLTVYTVHLLLLHGSSLNPDRNILKLLGSPRTFGDSMIVMIALVLVVTVAAWSWTTLKRTNHWSAKGLQFTLATYLFYSFMRG